jgi:hypothetical protein
MHCKSSARSQSAHDTAATILAFLQSSRTPHAHINLLVPRSPPPSHHAHARAQTHTTRQAPPSTTARQHHGAGHPKHCTPTRRARHIAHSNAAHNSQVPPARRTSRAATTTAHCANITARTPPHARNTQHGTQLRAPHTPPTENHNQSHTRPSLTTLTAELSGCPASTGCCRRVGCCSAATACRTHERPSRHTMAPDAAASQQPTTHHNQFKSNETQAQHRVRVTPKRHKQTAHRYLLLNSNNNNNTATANSECMPRGTHMQNQQHDDVWQPKRRVDTQPRTSRASTHTTKPAPRRRAATRRRCTSSSTCHETAPQPRLKLLRIATAAVRLLPLTAAATVQ